MTTILPVLLIFALLPASESGPTAGARAVRATCESDGTMRIAAALGGDAPRTFVVDTGSSLSFVETELAASLRLPAVGSIASMLSDSATGTAPVVAARISIAGTDVGPIHIVTGTRARLRGLIGRTDAGIIGMDVIRTLGRVTVDYDACRMEVGGAVSDRRAVTLPLEWHEGRPVVVVPRVGRLLLDSGASTLIVFAGTPAAATFRPAPAATSLVRIRRVTGDSVARLGTIPSLPLGGLELSNIPTVVVRGWYGSDLGAPDGLLPLMLFSRVHFDSVNGQVILSR